MSPGREAATLLIGLLQLLLHLPHALLLRQLPTQGNVGEYRMFCSSGSYLFRGMWVSAACFAPAAATYSTLGNVGEFRLLLLRKLIILGNFGEHRCRPRVTYTGQFERVRHVHFSSDGKIPKLTV
jgi:hypothetical protein